MKDITNILRKSQISSRNHKYRQEITNIFRKSHSSSLSGDLMLPDCRLYSQKDQTQGDLAVEPFEGSHRVYLLYFHKNILGQNILQTNVLIIQVNNYLNIFSLLLLIGLSIGLSITVIPNITLMRGESIFCPVLLILDKKIN